MTTLKQRKRSMKMQSFFVLSLALGSPLAMGNSQGPDRVNFHETPFEVCKAAGLISKADYERDKKFWDEAVSCGAEVQVMPETGFFRSLVSQLNQDHARQARSFLTLVGERAAKYAEINNSMSEIMARCARGDRAWFEANKEKGPAYDFGKCDKLLSDLDEVIKEQGRKMRIHNWVVRQTNSVASGIGGSISRGLRISSSMDSVELSADEKREAEKLLADSNKEIDGKFQEWVKGNKEKYERALASMTGSRTGTDILAAARAAGVDSNYVEWHRETNGGRNPDSRLARPYADRVKLPLINEVNNEHYLEYMKAMQKAPIMNYLQARDENHVKSIPAMAQRGWRGHLAEAADKLLANGRSELAKIQSTLASSQNVAEGDSIDGSIRNRSATDAEAMKALETFMSYGGVVGEILNENKGHCAAATGVLNQIQNVELRNNVLIFAGAMTGIGAVAAVGPAALAGTALAGLSATQLATVAGMGVGGAFYWKDWSAYLDANRRANNVVHTDTNREGAGHILAEAKQFEEARGNVVLSMALAGTGMDFWGLGLAKGVVAVAAGRSFGAIADRAVANPALRAQLRSKGLADSRINALLSNFRSLDNGVRDRAGMEMIQALGLDGNEIRLIREMAAKNLIGPVEAGNLNQLEQMYGPIRKALAEVPQADRARVFDRAVEVMNSVNAAKINAGNRMQALDAVMAASRFGVDDPKRLAAVINDWEQGLDGLARTYDLARQNLNDVNIARIASADDKQRAAFAMALDQSMARNAEFSALQPAQRKELKEKLMSCGGFSGAR
jgi:hypothetical protein